MNPILRGEIYYATLDDTKGSEQTGQRPVLILQRNRISQNSPTAIVVPITTQIKYPFMRAHCLLDKNCPLHEQSMVLTEQIRAIDRQRLGAYVGRLKVDAMRQVEQALRYSLGLCR